jgi:hypothetical protein
MIAGVSRPLVKLALSAKSALLRLTTCQSADDGVLELVSAAPL